jgi:hypothetical protein
MSLNEILISNKNLDIKLKDGKSLYKQNKVSKSDFIEFGKEIVEFYIDNKEYSSAQKLLNYLKKISD